jgi:hypothetical protein
MSVMVGRIQRNRLLEETLVYRTGLVQVFLI